MSALPNCLEYQKYFSVIPSKFHQDYVIAFDTETWLIGRGRLAPRLVCGSIARARPPGCQGQKFVLEAERFLVEFERLLDDTRYLLVGHNLAFDLAVICVAAPHLVRKIFVGLRDGRFADTKIRQILIDIGTGEFRGKYEDDGSWTPHGYSLDDLCFRHGLPRLDKSGDSWRLRYSELDGVRAEDYPEAASTYAIEDADSTRNVYLRQNEGGGILNEQEQCRAAFALQMSSVWGIRTDKETVDSLHATLREEAVALLSKMGKAGIFRADGTKDTKVLKARVAAAYEAQGLPVPMSEPSARFPRGQVRTDADTLRLSADPLLVELGDGQGPLKLLNTFIPAVLAATEIPLQPGYEVLVVTGRTSCRNPTKKKKGDIPVGFNVQQMPRDRRDEDGNILVGIRNCFKAREGYIYCSCDYPIAELRALGELHYQLFGVSALRDVFLAGEDPHMVMAAAILDKPLDWCKEHKKDLEVKDARMFAKVADFGIPGGLGAPALVDFARMMFGITLTLDFAITLIRLFYKIYPEQKRLSDLLKAHIGPTEGTIHQLLGAPIRHGGRRYTQAANLLFQAAVAQVAKEALWRVTWEMYLGDGGWSGNSTWKSPLYGSRVVAFIHDEILAELVDTDVQMRHDAAHRLAELMGFTMEEYFPNVPTKVEPALMYVWDKEATAVLDDQGLLQPWVRENKKEKVAA